MKLETLTRDTLHEERAVGRFRPSTVLGTLSFVEGPRTVMNHAGRRGSIGPCDRAGRRHATGGSFGEVYSPSPNTPSRPIFVAEVTTAAE